MNAFCLRRLASVGKTLFSKVAFEIRDSIRVLALLGLDNVRRGVELRFVNWIRFQRDGQVFVGEWLVVGQLEVRADVFGMGLKNDGRFDVFGDLTDQ